MKKILMKNALVPVWGLTLCLMMQLSGVPAFEKNSQLLLLTSILFVTIPEGEKGLEKNLPRGIKLFFGVAFVVQIIRHALWS